MKIESVRIQNFRGYSDATIEFGDYTCLVGRNGCGKSTVLHALNLFFRQFKDTSTDLARLSESDFHHKNTGKPIEITVTFTDLSDKAKDDLKDYVRQDKLIVTAAAEWDATLKVATVRQYGNRLGMQEFRGYFEADKAGKKVSDLKTLFGSLRQKYPGIAAASVKAEMETALKQYEAEHPRECEPIRSEDQFYGATKGASRLAPHVQWVFVPAAKDYAEEAEESKDSALAQLLARTVRLKTDFDGPLGEIRSKAQASYAEMLKAQEKVLSDLSTSLEGRIRSWAHPAVSAKVVWKDDVGRSVKVEEPAATVRLGERGFTAELSRFGHGLQRAYLLSLLLELSTMSAEDQPTLILGVEEPEIYQHPPQARHLAEVLRDLSSKGAQVVCCSHSPHFVPGADAESVRFVREEGDPCCSVVSQATYQGLAARLEGAGEKLLKEQGMLAKLYPTLNPLISEMFFCSRLILVEGVEDVAHLTAYLDLTGLLELYRRHGCHIVPVGRKSELARPVAVALELKIPTFVIWDLDTDKTKADEVDRHKKENRVLQCLLGVDPVDEWPNADIGGANYFAWRTNLTESVANELGQAWVEAQEAARVQYGQPGGLEKNPLAIAFAHEWAWNAGQRSTGLQQLTERIIAWAAT